jgi:hypothetical protein
MAEWTFSELVSVYNNIGKVIADVKDINRAHAGTSELAPFVPHLKALVAELNDIIRQLE